MSYRTIGYGVELSRLERAWGCADQSLLADILAANAARIRSHNEFLPADPEQGEISITDALEDIINGKLRDPTDRSVYQYLYALELLCLHLGVELDGDSIGDVENICWDTKLRDLRIPLGLSASSDFPSVSYLTEPEVKEEYAKFDADSSSLDDIDPEYQNEVEDAREDFLWWLKQCRDANVGIVTFYY